MILKKKEKKIIPDLKEFTDDEGHKWIQTSPDDLLSVKELSEALDKMSGEKTGDELVLARIDFQKVNREYYETVIELQEKLEQQNKSLKKLLTDAKDTIDRKNKKLKELVDYIRKLHLLLAFYKLDPAEAEKLIKEKDIKPFEPVQVITKKYIETTEEPEEKIIEYTDVEEILLDDDGKEKGPVYQ